MPRIKDYSLLIDRNLVTEQKLPKPWGLFAHYFFFFQFDFKYMKFREYLDKETPSYGGCMVCLAKYTKQDWDTEKHEYFDKVREEYLLIERHKCANGDIWTINDRPYYDYDFIWNKRTEDWKILYKREI